jgi:hypothetical protein
VDPSSGRMYHHGSSADRGVWQTGGSTVLIAR